MTEIDSLKRRFLICPSDLQPELDRFVTVRAVSVPLDHSMARTIGSVLSTSTAGKRPSDMTARETEFSGHRGVVLHKLAAAC